MIDVPVSLIGTFVVMAAMGFSINNLTLFGLVLAIGIVAKWPPDSICPHCHNQGYE